MRLERMPGYDAFLRGALVDVEFQVKISQQIQVSSVRENDNLRTHCHATMVWMGLDFDNAHLSLTGARNNPWER